MDADETLAAKAAAGDRDAFDELTRRYQFRLYQLTRILTRGDDDAGDLVQETFIRAFRAIGRFRGDSAFRTWLHHIAVNVIRSHAVRRRRRVPLVSGTDDGDGDTALDRAASTEDLEATVVRRRVIDQALAAIPEDARLVVTLRDIQGLEYQEIALIVGIPLGTVESRIFRARKRLRPLLAPLLENLRQPRRI